MSDVIGSCAAQNAVDERPMPTAALCFCQQVMDHAGSTLKQFGVSTSPTRGLLETQQYKGEKANYDTGNLRCVVQHRVLLRSAAGDVIEVLLSAWSPAWFFRGHLVPAQGLVLFIAFVPLHEWSPTHGDPALALSC